ncbi:hypothetical protein EW026_g4415 [Hermanssonia centrifuga]|uniref:RNA polymerase II assembly factor Rtp1 C-terminal domain-containing protein n=1 Tax=Hermanssonia centrifuga TaxID=98765 RepID=A0A4S4KH60_9APHY|nr:hypothetical protein EW026_g4415 [Hermanssonia centrifuga]
MQEPAIDRALVPGILSIFLQALQDDDSYIFLNAVQGLAAIVNGFGKDTLRGLVDMYVKGLDGIAGSAMIQQDVDVRTRVGEALGQVIKRCGDTLPSYAYILIPPLFAVVRTSHLPTALRTSSLSLLAQCVSANALSVIPYATDMTTAMVDLLQIETVPASRSSAKTTAPASGLETEEKDDKETEAPKRDTMTFQPTTTNSKIPTLRRAALHFLTLLLRAFTEQVEESSTAAVYALPGEVMRRAKTIIGYVTITDEDAIVRVMAKEGLDALDGLAIAMLGL